MKIAYVVHDYHRTEGHSRYVVELATRYAQEHEVHIFANSIEKDCSDAIQFHHVPAWRRNGLTKVLSFIPSVAFRLRGPFDIIHTQGLCSFRNNVITAHQCNRMWHASRRKAEQAIPWREHMFGAVVSPLEHLLYQTAGRSHVIAVSRRIADDLCRHYHCTSPLHVIYHGVDLEGFAPANRELHGGRLRAVLGLQPNDKVFLFVGDLRKGARQTVAALAEIPSAKLVFVSRSDDRPYRSLARTLGVSDRVIFAGPSKQVEQYYACADAFVLPTPYDPFALVVTEAMASALPVIVSRQAGVAELINHSVNGLILEDVMSVSELTALMRFLLADPNRLLEMGQLARRTIETMSWDTVAQQTMRVYEQLVVAAN